MNFYIPIKKYFLSKPSFWLALLLFVFIGNKVNADNNKPVKKLDSLIQNVAKKKNTTKNKGNINIPVAKHLTTKDTAYKTFDKIKSKYNSPEFQYKDKKINRLSWWERLKYRIKKFFKKILPDWHWNSGKTILRIMAIAGIVVLIFLLYRYFVSGNHLVKYEKKETDEGDAAYIEQNLENVNIQDYLDKALAENNYPLALRYLHLINLQALARKNIIEWDVNKTNQDFLQEIKAENLKKQFAKTNTIFEYVWFGNFGINKKQYRQYSEIFENFNTDIK